MQRRKNILIIISIIITGWIAQIIFSITYDPTLDHHAGLKKGVRVSMVNKGDGYRQLKKETIKNGEAKPIINSMLSQYNQICKYGIGLCIGMPIQRMIAGMQWLQTIQYIGKYINPGNPSDITNHFSNINDLSPLWPYPYIFAELLGPSHKKDTPNIEKAKITWENTKIIGEKGIKYTCDKIKLEKIKDLTYPEFLIAIEKKDQSLRSPCQDYRLPHNLAFNYFQYLGDSDQAAYYYMVASFHDDVPGITVSMPAIVRGRAGDNLVSANIRYDRFQNANNQYKKLKDKKGDESQELEKTMDNAIKKAVSEISIYIIDQVYPEGGSGVTISKAAIAKKIQELLNNCNTNAITCELIQYGLKLGWIKSNGELIYPIDESLKYGRREERKIRWLINKKS